MTKSEKILVGQEEICQFAGFSKKTWNEMMALRFPAIFLGGKWRAYTDNIELWAKSVMQPRGQQADLPDMEDEQC